MGDTIKETFTDEWKEILNLTLGRVYTFQNVNSEDLFLQQVPTPPDNIEVGKRLTPSEEATITKEASPVFVRSEVGNGLAYYNEKVVT